MLGRRDEVVSVIRLIMLWTRAAATLGCGAIRNFRFLLHNSGLFILGRRLTVIRGG